MKADVFDNRNCKLGEGLLWHPRRNQMFWFDILGNRLLSRAGSGALLEWAFDEHVSAAGWISEEELLIASESALFRFDLTSGARSDLHTLEADTPATRSNDGRADRWGGFWIGTMGKHAEPHLGSIYRYYKGELRRLVPDITVSNAICFAPDAPKAYFTDTETQKIMTLDLDPGTGWPTGQPKLHLDLTGDNLNPDGAVTDTKGNLWVAQWGASRVACYDPSGRLLTVVETTARQTSCPAFGGSGLTDLYATSAAIGLSEAEKTERPDSGKTFRAKGVGTGTAEPAVIL